MDKQLSGLTGRSKYKLGPLQVAWACGLFWGCVTYFMRNSIDGLPVGNVDVNGYEMVKHFRVNAASIPVDKVFIRDRHTLTLYDVPKIIRSIEADISKYTLGVLAEDHMAYGALSSHNISSEALVSIYVMKEELAKVAEALVT